MGFFQNVWEAVKEVPPGRVVTYGWVAKRLGCRDARRVGWALHANKDERVPCHRVVNREGGLAPSYVFGGWEEQRVRLVTEGVVFVDLRRVDLDVSGMTRE